ncbi:MAG: outer membrane beta-barrel protein [Bacteroidota bacterium]
MKINVKLIIKSTFVTLLSLSVNYLSFAQEDEEDDSPLLISGSVDTYYKYDFAGTSNIGTSFATAQNTIGLGMVNVIVSKTEGKVSFVGDISIGGDRTGAAPSIAGDASIQNLYASYALSDMISITGGFMGTFIGYEVISPASNFNYSTSYLFSNGPFQNGGLKLDFSLSDNFAFMLGAFTGVWDTNSGLAGADEENSGLSGLGAQIYWMPTEGLDIYANLFAGSLNGEWDITGGYQVSDEFYLGFNVASRFEKDGNDEDTFFGFALYPQYAFSETFSLGLRYENFANTGTASSYLETADTSFTGTLDDLSVSTFTLTAQVSVGGLIFIPEVRLDSGSENLFLDSNGAFTDAATQGVLAVVYSF